MSIYSVNEMIEQSKVLVSQPFLSQTDIKHILAVLIGAVDAIAISTGMSTVTYDNVTQDVVGRRIQ